MTKLNCAQIRERFLEIVLASPEGIQRGDIERQVKREAPDTPAGTISVQVNEAFRKNGHLIERVGGCYRPKSVVEASLPASQADLFTSPRSSTTFDLANLGFVPAGFFDFDGPHVRRNLAYHSERCPALYAFVIDGSVMYVGKTIMPLAKRLHFYAHPGPSQRTNIRNHASIREALDTGKRVEIWALVDWEPLEHRGVPINVAAGIEDALIERMRPPWNAARGSL